MGTLKTLAIKDYSYKNAEIQRIDTIEEGFSTLTAFPKRRWFVNGKLAFTMKYGEETRLGIYLDKDAYYGGKRTILVDFIPDCDFHIMDKEIVNVAMEELGKYIEQRIDDEDEY